MPDDKLPTPERVLVVAAHPDDIEFGAAGTVARWVAEGAVVRYLIVTRGDKGSDDPQADIGALTRLRETEQRAAAAELGVDGVDFLDEPDGQVEPWGGAGGPEN
jgi:LmbE family N-acetylglucosaminyl deacetylase